MAQLRQVGKLLAGSLVPHKQQAIPHGEDCRRAATCGFSALKTSDLKS
jgi:hypothetical protein